MAISPSSPRPRPRRARTVAFAFSGWLSLTRRALWALVVTVSSHLLNTAPEVNAAAAAAGPVHVEDSDSSDVQEEAGGNNPPHVALFLPNQENASPVEEMTSSPLPHYDAQSSVRRPPGQLESERESTIDVMGAHQVNIATDCPVHIVTIHEHAEDSGSSIVQEEGQTNPSQVALSLPTSVLLTSPIPEYASSATPVQEASSLMTSNPLPQDGTLSSVEQQPRQLDFEQESITIATEAHPVQHALHNEQPRILNQSSLSSDTTLSDFLVKATEVSVSGNLALIILIATYIWSWREATAPGEKSTSGLKMFIILATIAMFVINKLASSIAKADEHNHHYLGLTSASVIASFVWLVFLGGLMTHCIIGAAIWKIISVAIIVILVMLAIWAALFNHPKILRHCFVCWCCRGRVPDVAAVPAIQDETIARPTADHVSTTITSSATQLTLEDRAG